MDYSICHAIANTNIGDIKTLISLYDVNCQHCKHFWERVEKHHLAFPTGKTMYFGVGAFHITGHVPECFACHSPLFIPGLGWVDGERLESLWAVLNEVSPSARTASLAARTELLDDHMLDSNWKKLLDIGKLNASSHHCADSCAFQYHML